MTNSGLLPCDVKASFVKVSFGLFEHLDDMEIQLEKVRTIETGKQEEVWYKVLRD